nr:RecName: Full=Unknown protein from spot 77 of 2D-PAGE of etiolated coleoptile [Zea mays]
AIGGLSRSFPVEAFE